MGWLPQSPSGHPLLGSRHWRADPGVTAALPAPSASHLSSDNLQNLPTGLWLPPVLLSHRPSPWPLPPPLTPLYLPISPLPH